MKGQGVHKKEVDGYSFKRMLLDESVLSLSCRI